MNIRKASVDYSEPGWNHQARALSFWGADVVLRNFDFDTHVRIPEEIAKSFNLEFTLDEDPNSGLAHIRKAVGR